MQTVVFAAGRGTRMGPLTETTPKPMLPVAGRPLIAHVADAATEAGVDGLVVTVGEGADQIRDHLGGSYGGVPVRYVEQPTPLGTADALAAAADHLDGEFAVLAGDSLYRAADLERLLARTPRVGVDRGAGLGENAADERDDSAADATRGRGLVTEDGVVTEVRERPADAADCVPVGAYSFPGEALSLLDVPKSDRGELELDDVLARLLDRGDVRAVEFESSLGVDRPWELLEANERRLPGAADPAPAADGGRVTTTETASGSDGENARVAAAAAVDPDATIRGAVVVEPDASLDAGVVVEGPTRVCSGATVGPNAYVRGATLLGPDSHVGHAVEIKNSVLMAGATVGHLSYVGDSVLGPDVNLGAGTNVANLRHDEAPVRLTVDGERVSTGRRKFGTVLGPGVSTGIQTGIDAGVTLGAGVGTRPGEIVLRDR